MDTAKKENLKIETEFLLVATQKIIIKTSHIKSKNW